MKQKLRAGAQIAPFLRLTCTLILLGLGACGSLLPKPPPPPTLHLLTWDGAERAMPSQPTVPAPASLRINPTQATAGFDSRRIIYLREPYRLDYFANVVLADEIKHGDSLGRALALTARAGRPAKRRHRPWGDRCRKGEPGFAWAEGAAGTATNQTRRILVPQPSHACGAHTNLAVQTAVVGAEGLEPPTYAL